MYKKFMIPEFPEFKKIELSDKEEIEKFTSAYPPYSDFNFVSMWSWDTSGEMRISKLNGNLVVKFIDYLTKESFYSFIGNNNVEDTVDTLTEYSTQNNDGAKLKLIHEEVKIPEDNDDYILIPDQDNFDYVYNVADLYNCAGGKYETQRNLINRYRKQCSENTVVLSDTLSTLEDQILKLDESWVKNKSKTDGVLEFKNELEALKRIFSIKNSDLITTCLFSEGKLIGFCINELLPNSEYAIAHFAKADVNYPGIYSYLLNQNCKFLIEKGKKYLNYEQDLGLPELRYSKNSFKPEFFLKKFTIVKQ